VSIEKTSDIMLVTDFPRLKAGADPAHHRGRTLGLTGCSRGSGAPAGD
jgi:hypothetical protein